MTLISRKFLPFLILLLAGSLSPAQTSHLQWFVDPDGRPLPFHSNEEVEEFLRTAEIVSRERVGTGLNNPLKVLLEKDGIRMHAIFRDVHVDQRKIKRKDGTKFFFAMMRILSARLTNWPSCWDSKPCPPL